MVHEVEESDAAMQFLILKYHQILIFGRIILIRL